VSRRRKVGSFFWRGYSKIVSRPHFSVSATYLERAYVLPIWTAVDIEFQGGYATYQSWDRELV
jgi:hypothetical protein